MKRTFLSILLLSMFAVSAFAQTAAELKQSMADRKPAIDQMKLETVIGENNEAYLTILKTVSELQATQVQQENADRRAVYIMLSKQTGAPVDLVQEKRAAQLREIAAPGTMIQTPEGDWIVKQ